MKPATAIAIACLIFLAGARGASAEDLPLIDDNGELVRRPPVVGVDVQSEHVSKILYLNRCEGGCSLTPGTNDARFNTSSIVKDASTVSPWRHGDASWNELVKCVQEIYAPYDVEVTDVDPGSNIFHHEAIVAGSYEEIGYETPVGGVAPSQCRPANNVISFTFANGYANNPTRICHTVGQETAHSYGLEHAFDCSDPMTYLQACGRQFFRDATTPCGEFEALAQCNCGGSAQNSHRWLSSVLGENPNQVEGPAVAFQSPASDAAVTSGFSVAVTATHMRGVKSVELFLNGTSYGKVDGHPREDATSPYFFQTPSDLADGIIDIEVRATNDIGSETLVTRTVQKGAPCTSADTCNEGQFCEEGRCKFPPADGQLGDSCVSGMECESGLCPTDGERGYCSRNCFPTPTENTCPEGFTCQETGPSAGVCWPKSNTSACGCNSTNGAGAYWLALAFLGLCAHRTRRRARAAIR